MEPLTSANVRSLVLQCAQYAIRPLRVLELADAVRVAGVLGVDASLATAKEAVSSACTYPLQLSVDDAIDVVEPSADDSEEATGRANLQLAGLCASYLASRCCSGLGERQYRFASAERDLNDPSRPFAVYAARYCMVHLQATVRKSGGDSLAALYAKIDKALAVPGMVRTLFKVSDIQDAKIVTALLNISADSSRYLRRGMSEPIELAAWLGLVDYAKRMLETTRPELPEGLLSYVCANGDVELVKLLVAHGGRLEEREQYGYGPLHCAIENDQAEVFTVLMKAGANLLAKSNRRRFSRTHGLEAPGPLKMASVASPDMIRRILPYLNESRRLSKLLIRAVRRENVEGVIAILEDPRVDVNAHTDPVHQSRTPLYYACVLRNSEIIARLLNAGASTNPPKGESTWDAEEGKRRGTPVPLTHVPPLHAYSVAGDVTFFPCGGYSYTIRPFDPGSFDLLLAKGASVNQRDSRKNTALHAAVDADAVRNLIKASVDYNAINDQGRSFLRVATKDSHWPPTGTQRVLTALEVVGDHLDFTTRDLQTGRTPLLEWLACGQYLVALRMLERGADGTEADARGNGSIHLALENPPNAGEMQIAGGGPDFKGILQALVQRGAEVDSINDEGKTPLHLALVESGRLKDFEQLVSALLDAGADVNKADAKGRTPLFQLLTSNPSTGATALCRLLVSAGARININDKEGRPLIFESIGSEELLSCLVDLGGDPNVLDKDGNTLWHEAASHRRLPYDLSSTINSFGLDERKLNVHGQHPLHHASWIPGEKHILEDDPSSFLFHILYRNPTDNENLDSHHEAPPSPDHSIERFLASREEPALVHHPIHYLLKQSFDIDIKDSEGVTPLHLAITSHDDLVKKILSAGADASSVTNDGVTSLQIAAAFVRGNSLGMLLQNLGNAKGKRFVAEFVARRNVLGHTALYYACASGRLETVQMLLDAGAVVKVEDFEGSAWHGCSNFGDFETTRRRSAEDYTAKGRISSTARVKAQNLHAGVYSVHQDHLRLEDILSLLWSLDIGAPMLWEAMECASENGNSYALDSLRRFDIWDLDLTDQMKRILHKRKDFLATEPSSCCNRHDGTLADLLLKRNQLGLKKWWANQQNLDAPDCSSRRQQFFLEMTETGNWMLLRDLIDMNPQTIVQAEVEMNQTRNKWLGQYDSLLIHACKRDIPNLGTVCFLVRALKAGFDVLGMPERMSHALSVAVHTCVQKGCWWHLHEALPHLIEEGADVNSRNDQGSTALSKNFKEYARCIADLERLLALGCNPNVPDDSPGFRRHYTLLSNCGSNKDLLRLLMDYGAVPTQYDLRMAIEGGDVSQLERLLANGADPNTRHQLAEKEKDRVRSRQHHQKNTNNEDNVIIDDMYALHYAALDLPRNLEALALLLEYGADPRLRYEDMPMMHAIMRSPRRKGDFPESLLQFKGLDLENRDHEGATLLLVACSTASNHAVFKLLELGADINATDDQGRNALHHLKGDLEVFERITAQNPELVTQRDLEGRTALHQALAIDRDEQSRDEIALLLLTRGADPHAKTKNGDSVLHMLLANAWSIPYFYTAPGRALHLRKGEDLHHEDGQRLFNHLVSTGTDVNAVNARGQTPVFYFFGAHLPEVRLQLARKRPADDAREWHLLDMLDSLGVDFKAIDNDGKTLLHVIATSSEHKRLSRFKDMMNKGLDPRVEDGNKQTALDVAARCGAKDISDWYQSEGCKDESTSNVWVLV